MPGPYNTGGGQGVGSYCALAEASGPGMTSPSGCPPRQQEKPALSKPASQISILVRKADLNVH